MSKKVAILQSNYIPWKGYFDIIASVDEFIIYDDMQYTKRDWRNRNKIKTAQGLQWLTVPVKVSGRYFQKINETEVVDDGWWENHWKAIEYNYRKAPFFENMSPIFKPLFKKYDLLSELNYSFIQAVCEFLKISTKITWSSDYKLGEGKTEKLVSLCQQAEATEYVSGPAAINYIDTEFFTAANIKLSYVDYQNYPEYPQLFLPFEHGVSILDLIFNAGPETTKYMKSF